MMCRCPPTVKREWRLRRCQMRPTCEFHVIDLDSSEASGLQCRGWLCGALRVVRGFGNNRMQTALARGLPWVAEPRAAASTRGQHASAEST